MFNKKYRIHFDKKELLIDGREGVKSAAWIMNRLNVCRDFVSFQVKSINIISDYDCTIDVKCSSKDIEKLVYGFSLLAAEGVVGVSFERRCC